jgi:hypothetical protein
MLANPSQIIVTIEGNPILAVPAASVHHRHFPEVRGEGHSLAVATARLAELLSRTLDNAPSDWRREMILGAIEDVRAFAGRDVT